MCEFFVSICTAMAMMLHVHDRITTTEKYLRLVPEAYMEVTEPFNERFHTITEVLCNEE